MHNQIFLKPKVIYIYYDFKHELIFSSVEYVTKILFSVEKEKRKKKEEMKKKEEISRQFVATFT